MSDFSGFAYSYMEYKQPEPEWYKYRGMGFHPVWFGELVIGGGPVRPDAWECRRGCGSLVWDPEAHMKDWCTEWAPRVGDENVTN